MIAYRRAEKGFSIARKEYARPQLDPKLMTVVADRVFGTSLPALFGTEFASGRPEIKQTQGL